MRMTGCSLLVRKTSKATSPPSECNDIIRKLSLKSFESPYKILILWMPEYLGKEGNKLLKLIEEPPPNTLVYFGSGKRSPDFINHIKPLPTGKSAGAGSSRSSERPCKPAMAPHPMRPNALPP